MNPTMMGTLMDLILPSAQTVEKLSYGDPLFRMPPSGTGGYIPQTADKQYVAEVAGMLPLGAPAAKPSARALESLVREIRTTPPVGAVNIGKPASLLDNVAAKTENMFETGKEVTFPFIKNTEKAPKMSGFAQDIEPSGNYILNGIDANRANLPQGWISGEVTFKNPLVLDWGKSGLYTEPDNWKQVLSKQYGGKTGKELSKAIAKDGYDGIVTKNEYGTSEIVDITMFRKKPKK